MRGLALARGPRKQVVAQAVGERPDVPSKGIIIDSVTPPNFAVGDPDHVVMAHLENFHDVAVAGVITFGTTNAAVLTVNSSTGAATAVGTGTADVTLNSPGVPQVSVTLTVTSPIGTVDHIDISAATLVLDVGSAAFLTATPRTVGGAAVTSQTLDWTEQSGAGDVTLSNYAGPESHQIRVLGLVAGTRVIRVTHAPSGAFVDCTVTINAVGSYVHPTLGIVFPLCPATGMVPIHLRLMGSTGGTPAGTPTGATRSVTHNPLYTGYDEGCDPAGESNLSLMTDARGPYQAAREIAYPGGGQRCIRMRMNPGTPGQQSYSQFKTFQTSSTVRWTDFPGGSAAANKLWRRLYECWVVMFEMDYFLKILNKFGFVGMGTGGASAENCFFLAIPNGTSTTTPAQAVLLNLGPIRTNFQGLDDNNLICVPGDRGGQINFTASPPGSVTPNQVVGGQSITLIRGERYRLERFMGIGTEGLTDGWHKLQISKLLSHGVPGVSEDVWEAPVVLHSETGLTGLDMGFNEDPPQPGIQSGFRSVQRSLQNQYVFPGTDRFARSGNHGLVTLYDIPCMVNGTRFTLAAGATLTPPAKTLGADRWGICKILVDEAGVLSGAWNAGDTAGEQGTGALDSTPLPGTEEIGWLTMQAGPSGWTQGTDAHAGGTGGSPALTTNYRNRSGVRTYLSYLAMSETP